MLQALQYQIYARVRTHMIFIEMIATSLFDEVQVGMVFDNRKHM